jgi:hypothetical protein
MRLPEKGTPLRAAGRGFSKERKGSSTLAFARESARMPFVGDRAG